MAISAVLAAIAVAWRPRSWRPIWITAVTLGGAQLLVFAIKILIARPRPDCMTTRWGTTWATAWLSVLLLALAIGPSRVYLSVHYPSDVIGGWLLGATWLITVGLAVSLSRSRLSRALRSRTQRILAISGAPRKGHSYPHLLH